MRRHHISLAMVGVVIMLAGCTAGDTADDDSTTTTTTTAETTSAETQVARTSVEMLRLTFNGEDCIYEGPTELTPGPVELIFTNEDEEYAIFVDLEVLDEGKTLQDMIDSIGPEPAQPSMSVGWAHSVFGRSRVNSGETRSWARDLESGLYTMVCTRVSAPTLHWYAGGITIQD